ncbi:MAG: hypothetical protein JSU67_07125 [Gammaproteobacteria bacterium]|nr:MAG: hypothetical protein EP300_01470 [Gammaproteobacteria bacterium]UCH41431.1 MAG: hypothetical protein JSU67_07125 [Gammaproteobacteria bacterium]
MNICLILLLGIGGCSNNSYYADAENAMNTSGYYHVLDHIAAYYPSGISLNFPGYVVGFEESPIHMVTNGREDLVLDESARSAGYSVDRLLNALKFDVQFISQIMRYEGKPYGEGNCALYSLYFNHGVAAVAPCSDDQRNGASMTDEFGDAFVGSWDALDILRQRIDEDIATNRYTHLVVAAMGLDTAQEEAIRNYKSIVSSIRKSGGEEFNPLFIGVTWPSFYANRWFDPLWEALAYPPIADRADTLGLTWLGILLNDVIMPFGDRIEVNLIAHSFGARAATVALCVGSVIKRDREQASRQPAADEIENFIGLAAAFSMERFLQKNNPFYEDIYYRDYCPKIKRFVFTASDRDRAFFPVFWSESVGDHDIMLKYCRQKQPVSVSCSVATADGAVNGFDAKAKVNYIDTSQLMKYTMPGTEGGSHSDIYRPEVGSMLWRIIDGSAP